jgi:hypothetical protein
MNKTILIEAFLRNGIDYEKSVIYAGALFSGMEYIVTRNAKGFQSKKVIQTPQSRRARHQIPVSSFPILTKNRYYRII